MKLLSINVGLPREVEWQGETVRTSIFKAPVAGRVRVRTLNLQGDQQSDLTVHGGVAKAVYVYPSEHYPFWAGELPDAELPIGVFGENLTTEGLTEDRVCIGDTIRCGSVEFIVTQPRMPCYKLGLRFGRLDMVKRFQHAGRNGFYLAVRQEGEIGAGDRMELTPSDGDRISVAAIARLYTADGSDQDLLRRASQLPALPDGWRERLRARLHREDGVHESLPGPT